MDGTTATCDAAKERHNVNVALEACDAAQRMQHFTRLYLAGFAAHQMTALSFSRRYRQHRSLLCLNQQGAPYGFP